MKAIVGTFLPLCIFSFLAFAISIAVLGVEDISGGSKLQSEYSFIVGEYSNIEVISHGIDVTVFPSADETTEIFADKEILDKVSADIVGDTLVIKCKVDIKEISDLFSFGDSGSVKVSVPAAVYNSLNANISAGTTKIINIGADTVDLGLNAGELIYSAPEGFTTQDFSAELNAGDCTLYNIATNGFELDISAGNMNIYGLSGNGEISASAGAIKANFAELNGDINVDVSAGSVDLNLPDGISAQIECDISAGDVTISRDDIREQYDLDDDDNVKPDDGDTIKLNGGEYGIICEVSAGDIEITDNVKVKQSPEVPVIDYSRYKGAAIATTATEMPVAVEVDPIVVKVD